MVNVNMLKAKIIEKNIEKRRLLNVWAFRRHLHHVVTDCISFVTTFLLLKEKVISSLISSFLLSTKKLTLFGDTDIYLSVYIDTRHGEQRRRFIQGVGA